MKFSGLLAFFLSVSTYAGEVVLKEYNYSVADISARGYTTDSIFKKMDRSLIKMNDSICSNRAEMWAWDFKLHEIESAKIFLFFTGKTGTFDGFSWWYHVSPILNEKGTMMVMDAGNPHKVFGPLSVSDWLVTFTGKQSTCKEIKNTDTDLLELMFSGKACPEKTKHGTYHCYYKITPPGYWTPSQVAMNALGKDENGRPIRFEQDLPVEGDVYQACREASTSLWGRLAGVGKGRCRYFIENGSEFNP